MITINTVSASKFSYNGINYFKNFTPVVSGNKISILNTYDACISLTSAPTHFSEYIVNGQTFSSVALLQDALLPIIFTKSGLFTTQWGEIGGSISAQADLQNVLNEKADLVSGKVPSSQLPSFVDDVLEFANLAAFPSTGETGKIYIALDNNKVYRWSGTAYIEVAANSGVWGAITGTLSNQTDLQTALNLKMDLTGGNITGALSMNGGPSGTPPITMIYDEGVNRLLAPVLRLYGSTDISSKYIELDGLNATANRSVKFPDTSGNAIVENLNGQTGFGTIPKGIGASKTIELGSRSALYDNNDSFGFVNNGYNDGAWKYKQTGYFNLMAATEGQFVFYTAPSGAQNTNITLTERFRITQGGNVVVANLGTGTVYSNSGTLTNTNPSDERLKENIEDLGYGLNEILQLRPVSYNWINDTANQGTQFGFIAQEVQEIMPELINEFTITEDDEEVIRLGLDKEAIFVTLVNAIKELKAEIELLKQ